MLFDMAVNVCTVSKQGCKRDVVVRDRDFWFQVRDETENFQNFMETETFDFVSEVETEIETFRTEIEKFFETLYTSDL